MRRFHEERVVRAQACAYGLIDMPLSLAVQFASNARTLPSRAQVRRWALALHALACEAMKLKSLDGEITIRYVDEKEGRELNKSFRGKDYATNVLTFVNEPLDPHPFRAARETPSPGGRKIKPHVSADIAICVPVLAREAREQKKTVHAHHAHMVVHGMLHAMGFDHENDADAETMEALEIRVLSRFRINNPYL
jgi:probable rRNA maturation factor